MAVRYRTQASATSDAGGTATFTFQAPPTSTVLTGSVCIPTANSAAVATATIGGIVWGSWGANSTFGPVQQWASETISIVATGLTPLTAFTAVFLGMAEDEQLAQIVWPSALATAIASTSSSASVVGYGFQFRNQASQSIPNATETTVAFDTTVVDTNAGKSGNSYVVPTGGGGLWLLQFIPTWFNFTATSLRAFIKLGGATYLADSESFSVGTNFLTAPMATCLAKLSDGNTLTATVIQNNGAPQSLAGNGQVTDVPMFLGVRLGS